MKKSASIKGILIIVCIILLFCTSSCQKETSYFKDIHLGMSRNEIIERNKGWEDPQLSEQDYIVYENVEYNDLNGEISYTFDSDGKLIHSSIRFIPKEKKSSDIYNKLVKNLSKEYGSSTKLYDDATIWKIKSNGKDGYILCAFDGINDKISLILCTPEIYDWIARFKTITVEPTE